MTTALAANKVAQDAVSNTTKTLNALKAIADLTPDAKVKLAEATSARELAELRLINAQTAVNNLSSDVATKTKALADAKATLQNEEAKLEELKAQKAKDEKELASLQETVNALKANEVKIKDEIKSLQKGGTPVAILDENGQIVGYNSSFSRNVRTAVRTITDNVVSRHGVPIYQASLPETGEGETAVYTLSGITFLALAGVMRKKKL